MIEQAVSLPTRVWLVEPNQKQPYTLLMELPVGPRVRGLTWTPDGSAVILGQARLDERYCADATILSVWRVSGWVSGTEFATGR